MKLDLQVRRDLTYFLVGPGLACLAIAALFHVHPWPVGLKAQGQNFDWLITGWWTLLGAIGVALSGRVGCPGAPPLADRQAWRRIVGWSLGIGVFQGLVGVAKTATPLFGARYEALDRAAGFTWDNVALPWSIPHYFHASVISECFFRFGAIVIPVWLLSTLLLKGRLQGVLFWTFAVIAALIEPFEQAVLVKHMSFAGMTAVGEGGCGQSDGWPHTP